MKPTAPRSMLSRFVQGIVRRLLRHVSWHASESRNLASQPGSHLPLVLILGREHYSERQKTYPALRTRDLGKVLEEELAGEPPTLTLIDPERGDAREVRFFRLDRAVMEALPRSLFVVPESVVLGAHLAADSWADVDRQGYRYFLFRDGVSQPAGGALGQRDLVALAAGVDPDRVPEEYRGSDELLSRLKRSLSSVPLSTWWSCRNPLPRDFGLERVAWKPVAMTAGVMLLAYLVLTSLYLQASLGHRENALEVLEPQIREELAADNEARTLAARKEALIALWSEHEDTQRLWQAVGIALQNRAVISRIDMRDARVNLRGEAPDASEVLAALASMPGFSDVAFDAPVVARRGGRQSFALSFNLIEERGSGEGGSE